jgi:hypothetical protein
MLVSSPAVGQRSVTSPVSDAYGTLAYDQTSPVCAVSFVDISATGAAVSLTPAGAEPTLDEGGAVVILAEPFELYGAVTNHIVVSTNGYLAAASTLTAETGGDFSNDCPLPAIAEEGPSTPLRIAVLHDDLDGSGLAGPGTDGTIHHQHFGDCPRPSDALGAESCTIIQWSGWRVLGSSATFNLQAVLYHQSFEAVIQFSGGNYTARPLGADPHGATIGLQDATAAIGISPLCNLRSLSMAGSGFCFFEPRFPPPTADLWIELDDKTDFPAPGGQLEVFMTVVNPGPGAAAGAAVGMITPPEITSCTFSCTASAGSSCTPSGNGLPVADLVNLGAGGAAFYALLCDLDVAAAGGSVTIDATISTPADLHDPDPSNNTASVTTDIPVPVTLQRFTVD